MESGKKTFETFLEEKDVKRLELFELMIQMTDVSGIGWYKHIDYGLENHTVYIIIS